MRWGWLGHRRRRGDKQGASGDGGEGGIDQKHGGGAGMGVMIKYEYNAFGFFFHEKRGLCLLGFLLEFFLAVFSCSYFFYNFYNFSIFFFASLVYSRRFFSLFSSRVFVSCVPCNRKISLFFVLFCGFMLDVVIFDLFLVY